MTTNLIAPSGKLWYQADPRNHPHAETLRWHWENIFGKVSLEWSQPWG